MITSTDLGKHEKVVYATFGKGSIKMTRARNEESKFHHMLMFSSQEGRKVGEISNDEAGLSSDEINRPDVVFEFTNPESITALIHSLVEIQKEVFEKIEAEGKIVSENKPKHAPAIIASIR